MRERWVTWLKQHGGGMGVRGEWRQRKQPWGPLLWGIAGCSEREAEWKSLLLRVDNWVNFEFIKMGLFAIRKDLYTDLSESRGEFRPWFGTRKGKISHWLQVERAATIITCYNQVLIVNVCGSRQRAELTVRWYEDSLLYFDLQDTQILSTGILGLNPALTSCLLISRYG